MSDTFDLIIIGGGPTGINIGVEAQKAGLKYLILEKGVLANSVFHFPANMTFFSTSKNLEIVDIPFISHTDKPTRREALEYYRRIVESYQLNIHYYETVQHCRKENEAFRIQTSKGTYFSNQVAIATGFYDKPRMLGVPGEHLTKVKHYYDDAHPYVDQHIVVVGAANSACDVALETWSKGAHVTMVIRKKKLYEKVKYWILPNIENRIKEGSIKAYFESEIKEILPNEVVIETPDGKETIKNDFVLAMTGYKPDYDLFERLFVPISDDALKQPIFDEHTLETSQKGLYVAGVINSGMMTSKLFIENTRDHACKIVNHIVSKEA